VKGKSKTASKVVAKRKSKQAEQHAWFFLESWVPPTLHHAATLLVIEKCLIFLQPRINRLTLQGQYRENALVNSTQWFPTHEAFEAFDTKGELPEG